MKMYSKLHFVVALMLWVLVACAPKSKEKYLADYKEFVEEVKREHGEYDDEDWAWADENFLKYSKEWHSKFADELTLKEELKVSRLNLQYNALRGSKDLKDLFDTMFDEEDGLIPILRDEYGDDVKSMAEDLKEKMIYYRENHMEDDLNELKKAVEAASDTIPELMEWLK